MASLKFEGNSNFQTGTLASSYTSGGGSLSLTSGHGARFPSSGDFWVRIDSEVFKCTARTGDTLTVTGAADGTSAANHSAGATVKWVMGAAALTQLKADTPGLVLLEQHTASSSASLDFTTAITSAYDEYLIELISIIPTTDNVSLYMRMSTNGGSSYDSGNNYSYAVCAWSAGGVGVDAAGSQAQILLHATPEVLDTASAAYSYSGQLRLFNPLSASLYKGIIGSATYWAESNTFAGTTISGSYVSVTAVNAFQFLMSSGNIASGTIRVYGVKNA